MKNRRLLLILGKQRGTGTPLPPRPTAPTLLVDAGSETNPDTEINLTWTKSVDGVMTNYRVYINGILQQTFGDVALGTLTGLTAETVYSNITVRAWDGVRESVNSNSINVTTEAVPVILAIPTNIDVWEGPAAILLFKSGFESNVALLPQGSVGTLQDYQFLSGADEGFDWAEGSEDGIIPSWDDEYSGIHLIGTVDDPDNDTSAEIVDIMGHDGVMTNVLKHRMYYTPYNGNNQIPFQFNGIKSIPNKTYQRFWVRYDGLPQLTNSSGTGIGRMIWQYKSGNWTDEATVPTGLRGSIRLIGDNLGSGKLWWVIDGNIGLTGGEPQNQVWWYDTESDLTSDYGVNIDGWNLVELTTIFHATAGSIIFKLNGIEVFNVTNEPTVGATDTSIAWLAFWQFYGSEGEQWHDDAEVWSDDPNYSFTNTTSVSLSPSTYTLAKNSILQLTSSALPLNADNKSGVYTSSNESIAVVDNDTGIVTATAETGTATITFTGSDKVNGTFTDTCIITADVDVTAPEIVSMTVNWDKSSFILSDEIVMVFDEDVTFTNLVSNGFTIGGTTETAFSSISGSGTTWVGVLATEVVYGESPTVAYSSVTGDVADTAGTPNDLTTFTATAVTNNVPAIDPYGTELYDGSGTLGTGVTNSSNELHFLDVVDGVFAYQQNVGLTDGPTYKIEYEIYDFSTGNARVVTPYDAGSQNEDGTYTWEEVGDGGTTYFQIRAFNGVDPDTTLKLRNISIKEKI